MIMQWRSPKKPYESQKLGFPAGYTIAEAYEEATKLKRLLLSSGGYKPDDMKIVAIAEEGCLEKYQKEAGITVKAFAAEMKGLINKAKTLDIKGKGKRSVEVDDRSDAEKAKSLRTRG